MDAYPTPDLRSLFTSNFKFDVQISNRLIEGYITGEVVSEEALYQLMDEVKNETHYRCSVQGRPITLRVIEVQLSQASAERPLEIVVYLKGFDMGGLLEIVAKAI